MARILVVDDCSFQRLAFKDILVSQGHEPIFAENGAIGLRKAQTEQPDAILVDLNMPVIDGFQLLELLRKREIDTPAGVISADDQEVNLVRCRELGALEFVCKPVDPRELGRAIDRMLLSR